MRNSAIIINNNIVTEIFFGDDGLLSENRLLDKVYWLPYEEDLKISNAIRGTVAYCMHKRMEYPGIYEIQSIVNRLFSIIDETVTTLVH
jgi:hypothetical protein